MFVFPMAGQSSRFTRAGYTRPKFMLKAGDRTVFDRAIEGFSRYFDQDTFCFIYVDGQADPAFIRARCNAAGLPDAQVFTIALPSPTDGQARTVVDGLRQLGISRDEMLTIFNIDTFYTDFHHPDFGNGATADGYLDVFVAEGTHWSFVEPDPPVETTGIARRVVEKMRISNLCSTGLYHFHSAGQLFDVFDDVAMLPANTLQGGERYIAPLYQRLIDRGSTIRYRVIPQDQVAFCGTPDEYQRYLTEHSLEGDAPDRVSDALPRT